MNQPKTTERSRARGDIGTIGALLIFAVLALVFFAFARGF